jgi:hypothetical protein
MEISTAVKISLKNIANYGDTDIFPFPFENYIFYDKPELCEYLLAEEIYKKFDEFISKHPPLSIVLLTQVGYTGFRWATQIEPFWNAYYLALVVSIAEKIESSRIPKDIRSVFSYRYSLNNKKGKLFNDSNWRDYRERSIELSKKYKYVILTDIADFYPRIYHHRIDNALRRISMQINLQQQLMILLSIFSNNVSYGLPIGGPASRILAELALNPVDHQLYHHEIEFCRYADDYCIFCESKSDAYKRLVLLSEKLFNEGLLLQKNKTRILTIKEFHEMVGFLDTELEGKTLDKSSEEQKLLNISIRFDPYSATAEEDYERLKAAVRDVDIIGILGREVKKTSIDLSVTKQAINSIKALDLFAQDGAIRIILDPVNIQILSPVFALVMRAVKGVYNDLEDNTKDYIDKTLIKLYDEGSYLLRVDLNLSYYIKALSMRPTIKKDKILIKIYETSSNQLIRRLVILTMAKWKRYYWITDLKRNYSSFTEFEKRAFILASYILGDEGKHWRRNIKRTWSPMDNIVHKWFSEQFQKKGEIPI